MAFGDSYCSIKAIDYGNLCKLTSLLTRHNQLNKYANTTKANYEFIIFST